MGTTYSPEALEERFQRDAEFLRDYGVRGARLLAEIARRDELWSRPEGARAVSTGARAVSRPPAATLSPDDRRVTFQIFDRVFGYHVVLQKIAKLHMGSKHVDALDDPEREARHFVLGFAAYCSQLALGLTFIERTLNRPQFETLLDEGSEEQGTPAGAYAKLKDRLVGVDAMTRLFARRQYQQWIADRYQRFRTDPLFQLVLDDMERAYAAATAHFDEDGARLALGNAVDAFKDEVKRAWMPIQAEVARWMGDVKVRRVGVSLIAPDQTGEAASRTRPGDILITRRNWYLSNIGLPGFWPHAGLWIGTAGELAAFFDADPAVLHHYRVPFTVRIRERFPKAWADLEARDEHGDARRVLEAVSEGVIFTSAEHAVGADYAAALRPRLSKLEIAWAIERAFEYHGRPYDFDFDFDSDRELVCSELVYKAYEPRAAARGLTIELVRIFGRTTLPANVLIAQFDREHDTPAQQLDFVWFLDGRESEARADFADLAALRASHRRPKWDLAQE
jgi:Permuted papain-like amidase enzyme, YaeF/YiiX, C92 family